MLVVALDVAWCSVEEILFGWVVVYLVQCVVRLAAWLSDGAAMLAVAPDATWGAVKEWVVKVVGDLRRGLGEVATALGEVVAVAVLTLYARFVSVWWRWCC